MVEIRKATIEDAGEIFLCCTRAFRDYIPLIGKTPGPMLMDYTEEIRYHSLFVACEKEKIAGFVLIKDANPDVNYAWLDVLAVNPSFQRKGIGRSLLQFCENYILEQGKTQCRLYTHVKYIDTQNVYLHYGYQIYDKVAESGYERYYMRKNLFNLILEECV